jgi:hypothetical protein
MCDVLRVCAVGDADKFPIHEANMITGVRNETLRVGAPCAASTIIPAIRTP